MHRTAKVHAKWSFTAAETEAPLFLGEFHIHIRISFWFEMYDISVMFYDRCSLCKER